MQDLESHQLPLPLSGKDSASFNNFLVADNAMNNRLIVDALKSLLDTSNAEAVQTPIFISGASGDGKTHLLSALISDYREHAGVKFNGCYLDLSTVPPNADVLELASSSSLICIDNIDAWSGDEALERALFSLVNDAKTQKTPLVVTAKNAPENCQYELRDLVSRLKSGIEFALLAIDDETKFAALKLRAKNRGLVINDDAFAYLLNRYARDTVSLFASLRQLDRASIVSKRKVTIPFIQKVLG